MVQLVCWSIRSCCGHFDSIALLLVIIDVAPGRGGQDLGHWSRLTRTWSLIEIQTSGASTLITRSCCGHFDSTAVEPHLQFIHRRRGAQDGFVL